jgi:hypothetical protein
MLESDQLDGILIGAQDRLFIGVGHLSAEQNNCQHSGTEQNGMEWSTDLVRGLAGEWN